MDGDEEILAGGRTNTGQVVRRGNAVVRPVGEDRRVEAVLSTVGDVFDGAPRVLGRDEAGRLQLGWVPGDVVDRLAAPLASPVAAVMGLGELLRRLHDATSAVAGQLGVAPSALADPSGVPEVVCHCDPTPGNVVFRDGRPVALIDWEYAGPGRRAWDLAVAVRFWSPLHAPENLAADEQALDRVERARALFAGYGADIALRARTVDLLLENLAVTADNALRVIAARGTERYGTWVARGGRDRLTRDRDWLRGHLEELRVALV